MEERRLLIAQALEYYQEEHYQSSYECFKLADAIKPLEVSHLKLKLKAYKRATGMEKG